jgi:hypothetical protein
MLRIDLQSNGGSEAASIVWNGETYTATSKTGKSSICKLARLLVEGGCEDQAWSTQTLWGPSIHYKAVRVLSETDAGFREVWWHPHPEALPSPLMDAAVASVRASMDAKRQAYARKQVG